MKSPAWARRRWLSVFMSKTKPSAKQPTMQKKGETSEDRARARTLK